MNADTSLNVLPDAVAKDPNAEAAMVFVKLADGLTQDDVVGCLADTHHLLTTLQQPHGRHGRVASITMALGRHLFARFPDHAANLPVGLMEPIDLHAPEVDVDLVIYATVTEENVVPRLLNGLDADTRIVEVNAERGARTVADREAFGQRDGLRGVPRPGRTATVFVSEDRQPEEPAWVSGGTYGAFIKIQQNTDLWATVDQGSREQVIGRREGDGSRSDLPAGTDPHAEGEFADAATPPVISHVRKAGPRGPLHDQTLILRRGMPYTSTSGGSVTNGLLFVSYQATTAQLDVVLNDWMFNPDFPNVGAGQDALIQRGLITFLTSALFVVPPPDDRFPGAGFFDPPQPSTRRKSRIVVKKVITDANGTPARRERGGIEFTFIDKATGVPLGPPVTTTSAGRAVSPKIKVGTVVTVHETPQPERFEAAQDVAVTVTQPSLTVPFPNRLTASGQSVYR